MARKPKALVLDSWAVLAYLEDEDSSQKVADLIADAHENGIPLLMSVVNAGEVWYILAREISETEADKGVDGLRQLGIEFVDVDWKLARQAGTFKSKNRMSFADCFAAALAREVRASLVTGDKEFKQIENDVNIMWV
ncbi:MAG: type II toxin-antitoxin system VapC family toxin [Sulfuricaulis sp.]|uniref:type II toxin-antitoxin system VapC family toxin n=1 Tax=Sulfuricaulis sp. TaxID=2003553 RepID=UPI003C337F5F